MRVSTVITDIVQIINRSHSDLQNLDADDHKIYDLTDGTRQYIANLLTSQGDLLIRGATGLERLPIGEADQILKSQGAGKNPVWETIKVKAEDCVATIKESDTLRNSNDAEKKLKSTDWTKLKETKIGGDFLKGNVKVYYEFRGWGTYEYVYTRVYVNGNPIGTEHSLKSTTWTPVTEIATDLRPGDLIQLYGRCAAINHPLYVRNFRMLADPDKDYIRGVGEHRFANESDYILTTTTSTEFPATFENTLT